MKLYHVSGNNKNVDEIDMSTSIKNDISYVYFLMDNMMEYSSFCQMYHSQLIQRYSQEKGWGLEKIATEAIFEYIRLTEYSSNPSRLLYAYFTDLIDGAKIFNQTQRADNGDYFSFDADENQAYYYDMDMFDLAVKTFETNGLTEQSFEKIKQISRSYWLTSKHCNTEIIYKGHPVLKNITKSVKKGGI